MQTTSKLLVFLLLAGCRTRPADEAVVLRLEPPDASALDGILVHDLFRTPTLSAHLASATDELPAHYHARHEETIVVVSGGGRLWIDGVGYELEPGTLVHVPRGAVHRVRPYEVLSVISIFTPPFDGEDRVFVEHR